MFTTLFHTTQSTFTTLLYFALAIFAIGLIYRFYTWISRPIGVLSAGITTSQRFAAAFKGIGGTIFSHKIGLLIKSFFLDVLLQQKILKQDWLRWLMHSFIFAGFMLLLIFHALDETITEALFSDYYSTVNPFFFLRDLFGLMVLIGLGIAVYRRLILKVPRLSTDGRDHYAIIILAVIMISGVFLEATKITSYSDFERMAEDFAGMEDEEEIATLEQFWVAEYGLVSPNVSGPFDSDVIDEGRELNADNCAACHAPAQYAFVGYTFAKMMSSFAIGIDRNNGVEILYYIHFIACFIGLAYLPFSKMFHIIATPVSLLVNAVADDETALPANIVTRQIMELDACTHCGTCSLTCSSMMAAEALNNKYILPSEKMACLKNFVADKNPMPETVKAIREGVYLCTNCDRCTVVCPSGINLRALWFNVREDLVQKNAPEPLMISPFSFVRALRNTNGHQDTPSAEAYTVPIAKTRQAVAGRFDILADPHRTVELKQDASTYVKQIADAETFTHCFGCQNCTTICPVVNNYEHPEKKLGLLPHQIMCSLGLGQTEMASGAPMIWDCLTCYQCQEHCPQNVAVTDLFYTLKNLAAANYEV
ncbi:4Fe-4S dicluster domain-containing protein [Desulfococcaceae bacterium HSG9]|nr:4Fe-4S dicluster domain-containing protein [Desulfococcaceae bacterium HSG9]